MSVQFSLQKGHPERIHIQLIHVKQKYNWDCGISCVLMILPRKNKLEFLRNFEEICKHEGFNKSTWTIDLCYLLRKFNIKHIFCTTTLGIHDGHRNNSFYTHVLTKDENRVNTRFNNAANLGIHVRESSVSLLQILSHLINGPLIILTNSKLLSCDVCKLNKISSEIRKCIPWPVHFQGHYIVICGYDIPARRIFYRNPSFKDHVCIMSFEIFEQARRCYGTDEDIVFIYK